MNGIEKMLLKKIIQKLENESKDAEEFSQALFDGGDKPNAHFQEGRSAGMKQALILLKGIPLD